ncbi:MAG: hypothetical protein OCU22_09260 [Canidatus Methanoxibalbensis ujae]|nr:hypothetical protein [Candidatus Methanoxibalbensis ujae]
MKITRIELSNLEKGVLFLLKVHLDKKILIPETQLEVLTGRYTEDKQALKGEKEVSSLYVSAEVKDMQEGIRLVTEVKKLITLLDKLEMEQLKRDQAIYDYIYDGLKEYFEIAEEEEDC